MFSCFLNGVLKEFVTPILVWVYPSPYVLNPRSFYPPSCLFNFVVQTAIFSSGGLFVGLNLLHAQLSWNPSWRAERERGSLYKSFSDFSPSQTPVGKEKFFGKKTFFLFNIARLSSCFSALKLVICFAKNYVFVFIK